MDAADKFQPTWATKPRPPPPAAEPTYKPSFQPAEPTYKPSFQPAEPPPAARPILYNPKPPSSPRRRRRRGVVCTFLLLAALVLAVLLVLAAVAAAVLYALYRPRAPEFSLSTLRISNLNVSSSAAFSSALTFSLAVHNPNSKIAFSYDPISAAVFSSSAQIAAAKFPALLQRATKTTHTTAAATSKGLKLTSGEISVLKSALKKEKRLDLEIRMTTKLKAKIGKSSSKKIRFMVKCKGIKANANSKGKLSGIVKTSGVKCEGKLSYKIWKWNL